MKFISINLTDKQKKKLEPIYDYCDKIKDRVVFEDRPFIVSTIRFYERGDIEVIVGLQKNKIARKALKYFDEKHFVKLNKEK